MQASGRKALQSRDRHASHCRAWRDREQARCCSFILSLDNICSRGASLSLNLGRGRRRASGLMRRLSSTSMFPFISTGVVGERTSHPRRVKPQQGIGDWGVTNPLGMFQFALRHVMTECGRETEPRRVRVPASRKTAARLSYSSERVFDDPARHLFLCPTALHLRLLNGVSSGLGSGLGSITVS